MKLFVLSGMVMLMLAGIGTASEVTSHRARERAAVTRVAGDTGATREITTIEVVREKPIYCAPLIKPDTINIGNAGFVTFFRGPDAWNAAF